MIIYLDYYKAKKIDLKDYYRNYDNTNFSYKLLKGAPILVNVQGSYVEANDIPKLVVNKHFRFIVNQWVMELRNPQPNRSSTLTFKWKY